MVFNNTRLRIQPVYEHEHPSYNLLSIHEDTKFINSTNSNIQVTKYVSCLLFTLGYFFILKILYTFFLDEFVSKIKVMNL